MYAINYDDYKNYKIRRYGFHGTSHKYVSQEAIKYLKKPAEETKIVTCHLGGGSSISAVKGGKCIDTSMGFTPLAGVPMGTRSGDLDPAVLEYLAAKKHYTILDCVNYLNKECGVAGISGVSSDFRDLTKAASEGNERAQLALDVFSYDVKKYIGSYIAAMGGLDCLVFTAGIGENTHQVRKAICENMEYFGIAIDDAKNEQAMMEGRIAEITRILGEATVVDAPTKSSKVHIGSKVTVDMGGNERVFTIVGAAESDSTAGKISNESPVGAALLGTKKGDEIDLQGPTGRDIHIKVLKIEQ